MKPEIKNLILYIAKCVTGSALVFFLSWVFNYPDITWCLISVILVLTPESNEAIPLAITRIKANLIGGVTSFLFLLILPPNAVTIILVITISILACYFFNLMAGSRAAIAAVIIIMFHGIKYSDLSFWAVTLERIFSVIVGCIIGLLVTIIFHREFFRRKNIVIKTGEV